MQERPRPPGPDGPDSRRRALPRPAGTPEASLSPAGEHAAAPETGHSAYDVVVIGGGPAGSTAALVLARRNLRVLIVERERFPRFHIGESLLPRNMTLFRELGVLEKLRDIPHIDKHGVELTLGHEERSSFFSFTDCLGPSEDKALNVERAPFDELLLGEAEAAGATVRRGASVREILRLEDDDTLLRIGDQIVGARYVIDASGQSTVIGRHLRTRRVLPDLKKVAYFGHYARVKRHQGLREGYPTIVMMSDGWFWIIPLDESKTSVGLVMHLDDAKELDLLPDGVLEWGISNCPMMAERMRSAEALGPSHAIADYSYRCRPYAGSGYFLVGDAATFVDPVFSTGVCLGMMSAANAATGVRDILRRGADPRTVRREYIRYVEGSTSVLFDMVRSYYRHSFREVLLEEDAPLDIHRAVVSILAGNVFPKPRFALAWRLWLFRLFCRLQTYMPVAPRREARALRQAAGGRLRRGQPGRAVE